MSYNITMAGFHVESFKAQMKIQQTAFMLVALFLFFALAGIAYFSISLTSLKKEAINLKEKEALETVKMIAGTPELSFTSSSDCSNCIDLDKAIQIVTPPTSNIYKGFWNFESLEIERIYPKKNWAYEECTPNNYPNCKKIILIRGDPNQQRPKAAFVTLVRWDPNSGIGEYVYELGRIYATEKNIP